MGKGYHNYMSKKFFHPGNFENIKRVWMAQQKDEHEKKAEEDTLAQYQKEQEMIQNRALLGDEKAKLGLSFMYDPPPGVKRDREKEEDEPEYKFEWQRKYNAPRESYAKGDDTVRDQPFGIEVRNVRCLKCRKWGHINTDKICPFFGNSITAEPPQAAGSNPAELMEQMKEEGLAFTKKVLSRQNDPEADNQQMVESDAEADEEIAFFLNLNRKEKKKLVKKLEKARKRNKKEQKKEKRRRIRYLKDKENADKEAEEQKAEANMSPEKEKPRQPYRRKRRLSHEDPDEPKPKQSSRSPSPLLNRGSKDNRPGERGQDGRRSERDVGRHRSERDGGRWRSDDQRVDKKNDVYHNGREERSTNGYNKEWSHRSSSAEHRRTPGDRSQRRRRD